MTEQFVATAPASMAHASFCESGFRGPRDPRFREEQATSEVHQVSRKTHRDRLEPHLEQRLREVAAEAGADAACDAAAEHARDVRAVAEAQARLLRVVEGLSEELTRLGERVAVGDGARVGEILANVERLTSTVSEMQRSAQSEQQNLACSAAPPHAQLQHVLAQHGAEIAMLQRGAAEESARIRSSLGSIAEELQRFRGLHAEEQQRGANLAAELRRLAAVGNAGALSGNSAAQLSRHEMEIAHLRRLHEEESGRHAQAVADLERELKRGSGRSLGPAGTGGEDAAARLSQHEVEIASLRQHRKEDAARYDAFVVELQKLSAQAGRHETELASLKPASGEMVAKHEASGHLTLAQVEQLASDTGTKAAIAACGELSAQLTRLEADAATTEGCRSDVHARIDSVVSDIEQLRTDGARHNNGMLDLQRLQDDVERYETAIAQLQQQEQSRAAVERKETENHQSLRSHVEALQARLPEEMACMQQRVVDGLRTALVTELRTEMRATVQSHAAAIKALDEQLSLLDEQLWQTDHRLAGRLDEFTRWLKPAEALAVAEGMCRADVAAETLDTRASAPIPSEPLSSASGGDNIGPTSPQTLLWSVPVAASSPPPPARDELVEAPTSSDVGNTSVDAGQLTFQEGDDNQSQWVWPSQQTEMSPIGAAHGNSPLVSSAEGSSKLTLAASLAPPQPRPRRLSPSFGLTPAGGFSPASSPEKARPPNPSGRGAGVLFPSGGLVHRAYDQSGASKCRDQGRGDDDTNAGSTRMSAVRMGHASQEIPRKLVVTMVRANGLKHMNHFVGDDIYCVCRVRHASTGSKLASCQTKRISETLDPEWNEVHELEPWRVGEALDFTVYDNGLLGAQVEGSASLESNQFYPCGFDGVLEIIGGDGHTGCATLHVRVAADFFASVPAAATPESIAPPLPAPQRLADEPLPSASLQRLGNAQGQGIGRDDFGSPLPHTASTRRSAE